MEKKLLVRPFVILLLLAALAGLMLLSSRAKALVDGIIVNGEDYVSTMTSQYSPELGNASSDVTSRVTSEYGDFGSKLEMTSSSQLDQTAAAVSSRIAVEYADFAIVYEPQSSDTIPNVTSRIIVEYADSTFTDSLEPVPEFSSPIILLPIMTVSALVLVFAKKTRKRV